MHINYKGNDKNVRVHEHILKQPIAVPLFAVYNMRQYLMLGNPNKDYKQINNCLMFRFVCPKLAQ
jgi:hypothetical protein